MEAKTAYTVRQIGENWQVMANTTPMGYIFRKREDAEAKAIALRTHLPVYWSESLKRYVTVPQN